MPVASATNAWPFTKLCSCHSRSGAFRRRTQSSNVRQQVAQHARQDVPLRICSAVQAVAALATDQSGQQQPQTVLQGPQTAQSDTSSDSSRANQQEQASSSATPNTSADSLDPRSYHGTSDKARRKELVQYLATIPESEMTPEMLRRWRISKANRGKKAWNHGRRHPPETIAKITKRTKEAMLRPEVLQRVRDNHPSANRALTPKAKAQTNSAVKVALEPGQRRQRSKRPSRKKQTQQNSSSQEPAMASLQTDPADTSSTEQVQASALSSSSSATTDGQSPILPLQLHTQSPDAAQHGLDAVSPSKTSRNSHNFENAFAADSHQQQVYQADQAGPVLHQASSDASSAPASAPAAALTNAQVTDDTAHVSDFSRATAAPASEAADASVSSTAPAESASGTADTPSAQSADPEQKGHQSSRKLPQSKQRTGEHKRNIALALKKKWAEPEYRDKVLGGMRTEATQSQRVSNYKANVMRQTKEGRGKLQDAKAKQDQLNEARQTVRALHMAVKAGQEQAEALRGDPEGFARQQDVLNSAQELVARAQAQVAAMEAATPSLAQVAAELGARPSTEQFVLSKEERASADEDPVGEHHGPETDDISSSALQTIADQHRPVMSGSGNSFASEDVVDVTAGTRMSRASLWQSQPHANGSSERVNVTGTVVDEAQKLQPV